MTNRTTTAPFSGASARRTTLPPRPHRAKVKAAEKTMQIVFLLCALVAVAFVLLISVYLILSGLPAIREVGLREFLFGRTWASTRAEDPRFGILPMMLTSIYGAAGAIVLGVPLGFSRRCSWPRRPRPGWRPSSARR